MVSLVVQLPILRLQIGQVNLESQWFLFLTTFGQWVHAPSCSLPHVWIFSGDCEKSENWDPTEKTFWTKKLNTPKRTFQNDWPSYFGWGITGNTIVLVMSIQSGLNLWVCSSRSSSVSSDSIPPDLLKMAFRCLGKVSFDRLEPGAAAAALDFDFSLSTGILTWKYFHFSNSFQEFRLILTDLR